MLFVVPVNSIALTAIISPRSHCFMTSFQLSGFCAFGLPKCLPFSFAIAMPSHCRFLLKSLSVCATYHIYSSFPVPFCNCLPPIVGAGLCHGRPLVRANAQAAVGGAGRLDAQNGLRSYRTGTYTSSNLSLYSSIKLEKLLFLSILALYFAANFK